MDGCSRQNPAYRPATERAPATGLFLLDDFQASLGVARNILSNRLARLVEARTLVRVRYRSAAGRRGCAARDCRAQRQRSGASDIFRRVLWIVLALWVVIGLVVFVLALSGGPGGVRSALHGDGRVAR